MARIAALVAAAALVGCGGARPAAAPDVAPKAANKSKNKSKKRNKKDDPLFPNRERGWKALDGKGRAATRALADEYLRYIKRAATPRRAIAGLTDIARAAGAVTLRDGDRVAPGGFYVSVARGGTAAVFFRPGERPITDGLQIVVVSVDAPRIVLKQTPVDEHHGFAMLQTKLHGGIDLKSWMVTPLALYVYVDRGPGQKPTDLAIGAADTDPRFSIPDVLPHLAHSVQRDRKNPVRDPERLDVLAAGSRAALLEGLAKRGVSAADLTTAEAYMIPATAPTYVGVDRALIGGYGQRRRALAFAAIRGLIDATPDRAIAVIAVDRSDAGGAGTTGDAYIHRALSAVIGGLAPEADVYDSQRSLSRTTAMVASLPGDKQKPHQGVVLNIRSADSLPAVVAAARRALDGAGVQYAIDGSRAESPSRDLATLDLDAIDVSIAATGAGTPGELISILDLYQGYLACRAWLSHSR